MTTLGYNLTRTPTDIKAAVPLAEGSWYSTQFVGQGDALLATRGSAPDATTDVVTRIANKSSKVVQVDSEPVYAWVRGGDAGKLSFELIIRS